MPVRDASKNAFRDIIEFGGVEKEIILEAVYSTFLHQYKIEDKS